MYIETPGQVSSFSSLPSRTTDLASPKGTHGIRMENTILAPACRIARKREPAKGDTKEIFCEGGTEEIVAKGVHKMQRGYKRMQSLY